MLSQLSASPYPSPTFGHLQAEDLLSRGYFPSEVPPVFTTSTLAAAAHSVSLSNLLAGISPTTVTIPARHNLARAAGLRRQLTIPNPVNYLRLAETLSGAWLMTVNPHLSNISIGASQPIPSSGLRCFEALGQADIQGRKAQGRESSRYLLRADIQNFYPSIYTHSIPWALHGKLTAKGNRTNGLVGNVIDRDVRNGQDQQTVGIPVGPDSSWVIAECLMATVEKELTDRLGGIRGYRYIDDFELAFDSISKAENGLGTLQEILAEYELTINPRKTDIVEMPLALESTGVSELRSWNFRDTPQGQRGDLIGYFDRAFTLIRNERGGGLAAYAVARLRSVAITDSNWKFVQSNVFMLAVTEPSCARQVAELIDMNRFMGRLVDTDSLIEATDRIVSKHFSLGHGSEIAWCLWMCIAFSVQLSPTSAASISKMSDNFVALLAMHAESLGLVPLGLDKSLWQQSMTTDALRSESWLLSYEAGIKSWLSPVSGTDHIAADLFFTRLKANGVSFYDTSALQTAAVMSTLTSGGGGGYHLA